MSELHAAAEAAKRSIERTNYTVREYDLIRMDAVPTKEYQDLRTCRDALLAILSDPTSLLKRPEWQEHKGTWRWQPLCWRYSAQERHWVVAGDGIDPALYYCDSLEAAQAACWADYCARLRGAFITTP